MTPSQPLSDISFAERGASKEIEEGTTLTPKFDADGLIASSARRERFFLWPLGVENTGAMRQQGNHAIAFAGKRHFDEASVETLLDLDPPGLGH